MYLIDSTAIFWNETVKSSSQGNDLVLPQYNCPEWLNEMNTDGITLIKKFTAVQSSLYDVELKSSNNFNKLGLFATKSFRQGNI